MPTLSVMMISARASLTIPSSTTSSSVAPSSAAACSTFACRTCTCSATASAAAAPLGQGSVRDIPQLPQHPDRLQPLEGTLSEATSSSTTSTSTFQGLHHWYHIQLDFSGACAAWVTESYCSLGHLPIPDLRSAKPRLGLQKIGIVFEPV